MFLFYSNRTKHSIRFHKVIYSQLRSHFDDKLILQEVILIELPVYFNVT